MAIYKLFEGNREQYSTTFLAQTYGLQTSKIFEVLDGTSYSARQIFYGHDFKYSGFFYDGFIDRMDFFGYSGKLTAEVDDVNISVQTYRNALTVGTSGDGLYQIILQGDDNLFGSSGNDVLPGSGGSDHFDGGKGVDLVSYQAFDGSVEINLLKGSAKTSSGTSTLHRVEDISGSIYSDTLVGNSGSNLIQGLGGDDIIDGGKGIDTASYREASSSVSANLTTGHASGGSGDDTLKNIENLIGSRFNDVLSGDAKDNIFDGGLGNDTIRGSDGFDTVSYSVAPRYVVVNLGDGSARGGFGADKLSSIEGVIGSAFNDVLAGSSTDNTLSGSDGNDTLSGGLGKDKLSGGSGDDTFIFNTRLSKSNIDHIVDFSVSDDTIHLDNKIFVGIANGELAASAFKDITSSSTSLDSNDRILYNHKTGVLSYDPDGSGSKTAEAVAVLDTHPTLTFKDFFIL